jgi:CO/xanthine dehydrogenase FAD-binding subunit
MEYFSPTTIEETLSILAKWGEDAIPVAGSSFFMAHKDEIYHDIGAIIDIKKVGLDYIKVDKEGLKVGATATLSNLLENKATTTGEFAIISEATIRIKPVEIRNVATMGAMLSIGAELDLPTVLIPMDATLVAMDSSGKKRVIALSDLYVGYLSTALKPGELLMEVQVPHLPPRTGVAFEKLERRAVDLAVINAASRITLDASGKCSNVKIIIGGAGNTPTRLSAAEKMLNGSAPSEELIAKAAKVANKLETVSDIRSTAEVRKRWAEVTAKRSLLEAAKRAKGGA